VIFTSGDEPFSSHKPHAARCLKCGWELSPTPGNVGSGHGCPACSLPGFDPVAPATVYLIRHDAGPFVKVGITGADPSTRLTVHGRRGWEVLGTWPVPVGRDAALIEGRVVAWWGERGATRCTRDEVPDGHGWTEAVHNTAAAGVCSRYLRSPTRRRMTTAHDALATGCLSHLVSHLGHLGMLAHDL
jgi:hypothetical protein